MSQFQPSCVENRKFDFDPGVGEGVVQFIRLSSGITLTIMRCHLNTPVTLKYEPPFETIGFSFNLSGRLEALLDCRKDIIALAPGQSDMKWCPNIDRLTETLVPGELFRLSITMDHEVLFRLMGQHKHPFLAMLQKSPKELMHYQSVVTPQMRAVIFQILQCPYQDLTRELFIDGKILELLAYKFEQLNDTRVAEKFIPLKQDERDRVCYAAQLLTENLNHTLNMDQLAGSVGMCRTRFYECFRNVYGMTPLEYLRNHRLESAMNFLKEGQMNVTEAAFAVGYSSSGYFSKVFKKYFGDLPKHYCYKSD